MKKHGFTLAEVLIALGILGVVAALTTPTFVTNIKNSSNAARLSASISTLENAFTSIIAKEGVEDLFDADIYDLNNDRTRFAANLQQYITLSGFRSNIIDSASLIAIYYNGNGPYTMENNGSRSEAVSANAASAMTRSANNVGVNHVLDLKNGASAFVLVNAEPNLNQQYLNQMTAIRNSGASIPGIFADVWIDVNGAEGPNTMGRDIFAFYLGSNGVLYPVGGRDVALWDTQGRNDNGVWSSVGAFFACTNANKGDATVAGSGCTARLIDNNFKVDY